MKLICLPVTVQLVALEDFCPAFLQFVLRQLLWFFFVNLHEKWHLYKLQTRNVIAALTSLFQLHTKDYSSSMWLERTRSQSSDLNLGSFFEYMLHQNSYCDVSARSHYIVGSLLILKRWCNALKTWISSCDLGAEEKEICVISAQEQHQRICLAPPHSP